MAHVLVQNDHAPAHVRVAAARRSNLDALSEMLRDQGSQWPGEVVVAGLCTHPGATPKWILACDMHLSALRYENELDEVNESLELFKGVAVDVCVALMEQGQACGGELLSLERPYHYALLRLLGSQLVSADSLACMPVSLVMGAIPAEGTSQVNSIRMLTPDGMRYAGVALGELMERHLGTDERRWATAIALSENFPGSVLQLLEAARITSSDC